MKVDNKEEDVGGATEKPREEVEKVGEEADEENEAKRKKKSDDLWASFLSDVGSRPKESSPQSDTAQKVNMFCSLKRVSIFFYAVPIGATG